MPIGQKRDRHNGTQASGLCFRIKLCWVLKQSGEFDEDVKEDRNIQQLDNPVQQGLMVSLHAALFCCLHVSVQTFTGLINHSGSLTPRYVSPETPKPQNPKTPKPWNPETLKPWNPFVALRCSRASESRLTCPDAFMSLRAVEVFPWNRKQSLFTSFFGRVSCPIGRV